MAFQCRAASRAAFHSSQDVIANLDRMLLDESLDATIATSIEGEVLYWSKGAESAFGYTSSEAVGSNLRDLIVPPDRADEARRLHSEALASGVSEGETIRRKKDGSLVYVDLTQKAVRDSQGGVRFVLSSEKDITQGKVIRDARRVASRFQNLLEALPDSIVMVNAIGRIVVSNRQAEQLFGHQPGELIGQLVEILLPERFRDRHVKDRANYFAQPRARSMGMGPELYGRRKDGTEFPVEISLSLLETEEGTLVLSAIRDITERKRFESALSEKNDELVKANLAKDTILAGMSHELRTPLNAIIGFTGTLLMKLPGPLNADQQKQLQTVQSSGRHLLALINDLLDLAKIGAGKIELTVEDVVAQAVVEEIATELRPGATRKGLTLEIRMPEADVVVKTDRRALRQIILNLVGNAVKFTEQGMVSVVVQGREADGPQMVEFQVTDTGIGIRDQDRTQLFEAFAQVDSARRNSIDGTGLSLHLSQRLTERLGGQISFQSEYGKGSTFVLRLPG